MHDIIKENCKRFNIPFKGAIDVVVKKNSNSNQWVDKIEDEIKHNADIDIIVTVIP